MLFSLGGLIISEIVSNNFIPVNRKHYIFEWSFLPIARYSVFHFSTLFLFTFLFLFNYPKITLFFLYFLQLTFHVFIISIQIFSILFLKIPFLFLQFHHLDTWQDILKILSSLWKSLIYIRRQKLH